MHSSPGSPTGAVSLTPIFAGVRYDRLEGYNSLQWPVAKNGKDSPLLFTENFPFPDGKAKFHPIEWIEPCEERSPEFNHHLNNGRLLEHFEQGAMTYRSKGIREMTPTNFVEVSPELAARKGLSSGSMVRLRSLYGEATVPVVVTDRVEGDRRRRLGYGGGEVVHEGLGCRVQDMRGALVGQELGL